MGNFHILISIFDPMHTESTEVKVPSVTLYPLSATTEKMFHLYFQRKLILFFRILVTDVMKVFCVWLKLAITGKSKSQI